MPSRLGYAVVVAMGLLAGCAGHDIEAMRGGASDNNSVAGRGEGDQAVPTGDNLREAANRHVVILIQ